MESVDAWDAFCERMASAGRQVLEHPTVVDDRDAAEGLRTLSRQVVFALQHAMEFRDPDFPAFQRFDDDVTKWGGPNADNNYLRCAIDPTGTYRLTADVTGCRELILSLGEGDMQLGKHRVFSERSLRDLTVADDQLDVVISPTEHPDNWMPTDPAVRQLTIRVYVAEWETDAIPVFHIDRLDGPVNRPAELTVDRATAALEEAAHWVETGMPFWLDFVNQARDPERDNQLSPPSSAKGGAADIAYGAGFWNLGTDDAWVITFDQPNAFHWSIQTHTWPWFESGDIAHAQTSLNDQQAHIDTDGRVRVVVSHTDPGVPNWIDTEGRDIGMCVYRWVWSETRPTPDGTVVPIDAVRDVLPIGHPSTSPEERKANLLARRRGVHRRFRR